MILFLKKVFLLRSVNKANRPQIPCATNENRGNETGNKFPTPVKKPKLVRLVHITGKLFTNSSGLLGTFCPQDHFRQNGNHVIDLRSGGIPTEGKTHERVSKLLFHSQSRNDVRRLQGSRRTG
jgi:hypothetical protein